MTAISVKIKAPGQTVDYISSRAANQLEPNDSLELVRLVDQFVDMENVKTELYEGVFRDSKKRVMVEVAHHSDCFMVTFSPF